MSIPFTDLDAAWMQALGWAIDYPTAITLLRTPEVINFEVTTEYDVDSRSHPGTAHRNVCHVDGAGIHVSCGCARMRYRRQPCRHSALVLLEEGWLKRSQYVPLTTKTLSDLIEADRA